MKQSYDMICTKCGAKVPFTVNVARCPHCNEPLEMPIFSEGRVHSEKMTSNFMERYIDFYPYLKGEPILTLGEGMTGLVPCDRLADDLGFEPGTLMVKNETQNPTWSFKDRGTVVGINYAKRMGYTRIGACSSGNMAASVAAYASAFGMKPYIFVPSDIMDEKILPIAVYGCKVVKVSGDFGSLYPRCAALSEELNLYFPNSDVPMRVEGCKGIAFEICEQTGFNSPDWVFIPNSSGGDVRGIEKGFQEFKAAGLIDRIPKIVPVQAAGCAPVYKAYCEGKETISHFGEVHTVAHGVSNPFPPSGNRILSLVREGRLQAPMAIDDPEILKIQRKMALNGIFGQPARALGVAAAKKLLDEGVIKKGERVVAIVTGSGLKAASVLNQTTGYDIENVELDNIETFMRTSL